MKSRITAIIATPLMLVLSLALIGMPASRAQQTPLMTAATSAFGKDLVPRSDFENLARISVMRGRLLLSLLEGKMVFIPKSSANLIVRPEMKLAVHWSKARNEYALSIDGNIDNRVRITLVPKKLYLIESFGSGQIIKFRKPFPDDSLALILQQEAPESRATDDVVKYDVQYSFELSRHSGKSKKSAEITPSGALPLFELVKPVSKYAQVIELVFILEQIRAHATSVLATDIHRDQSTQGLEKLAADLGGFKSKLATYLKNGAPSSDLRAIGEKYLASMVALPDAMGSKEEFEIVRSVTKAMQSALIGEISRSNVQAKSDSRRLDKKKVEDGKSGREKKRPWKWASSCEELNCEAEKKACSFSIGPGPTKYLCFETCASIPPCPEGYQCIDFKMLSGNPVGAYCKVKDPEDVCKALDCEAAGKVCSFIGTFLWNPVPTQFGCVHTCASLICEPPTICKEGSWQKRKYPSYNGATCVMPTATPTPDHTETPVPPTGTPTVISPTASPVPTKVPPTATAVPPTATAVPPTATAVPPTATVVPPTATAVPPTATVVPPTATPKNTAVVQPTVQPTITPMPKQTSAGSCPSVPCPAHQRCWAGVCSNRCPDNNEYCGEVNGTHICKFKCN